MGIVTEVYGNDGAIKTINFSEDNISADDGAKKELSSKADVDSDKKKTSEEQMAAKEEKPEQSASSAKEEKDKSESKQKPSDEKSAKEDIKDSERVQKRINELTYRWREEERKRLEIEEKYKQLETAEKPKTEEKIEEKKIDPEDYDDYEDYLEAKYKLHDEEIKEIIKSEIEELKQEASEKEFANKIKNIRDTGRKLYKDFDEVVDNKNVPSNLTVQEIIMNSEKGYQLAYFLGKHIDVADKISRLSPEMTAYELGKIENAIPKINKETDNNAPPAGVIDDIVNSSYVDNKKTLADAKSMTQEEFEKLWKKTYPDSEY